MVIRQVSIGVKIKVCVTKKLTTATSTTQIINTTIVCFTMSSCNFNNLSFTTDSDYNYQYLGPHNSNVQSVPIQQSSQPMQKCTFQCVCCARLSLGSVCSCNLPKSNASTQTNNFEFPQETLMANNMWIKGTFEHGIVQVFKPMSQLIFHKFWSLYA